DTLHISVECEHDLKNRAPLLPTSLVAVDPPASPFLFCDRQMCCVNAVFLASPPRLALKLH
ncbi:hypothetical protein Bpfe_027395, partial [Biomphalaria pfeifferi]